jgi:FkbM family methyltransferase
MRHFKNIVRKSISSIQGKSKYQDFFETLHMISIRGMNYSIDGGVADSGEIYVLQYIKNTIKDCVKSIVVFDVGANAGEYTSSVLNELGGNNLVIHAFEPTESLFCMLEDRYKSTSNVKLHNIGLGDEIMDNVPFYTSDSNPYLNSIYDRDLRSHNINLDQIQQISVDKIDGFCEQETINKIYLLKIDVEGHEMRVLQGAKSMIAAGNVKFIQIEFGGCHIDSQIYFRDIFYHLNDKYKIYRVLKDGLRLIKRYDERLEVFMTVNFLAELR